MESIVFYIEAMHEDPIRLYGEFQLRAKQDILFNKTMIIALEDYIAEHNIKWNS